MKDYTLGDKKYQERFVLCYTKDKNGSCLVAHLANGKKEPYANNPKNESGLLKRMEIQLAFADRMIHDETIDFSKINLLHYLKKYFMVKSILEDFEKNKLILAYTNYVNEALTYTQEWTVRLPYYLKNKLVQEGYSFNLNSADALSMDDVTHIIDALDYYSMIDNHFPKRKLQKNKNEIRITK